MLRQVWVMWDLLVLILSILNEDCRIPSWPRILLFFLLINIISILFILNVVMILILLGMSLVMWMRIASKDSQILRSSILLILPVGILWVYTKHNRWVFRVRLPINRHRVFICRESIWGITIEDVNWYCPGSAHPSNHGAS
jgi:hypothetical protein